MLKEEQVNALQLPLPSWALKSHPTKSNMTVIHPMAVVDRLNDVFGLGMWQTKVEFIKSYSWEQKTTKGSRQVFTATSKVILDIPEYNIHLEQFGGSTNDDEGDAMKGSATDALTKIASYLGIGASIYKGQGNTVMKAPSVQPEVGEGLPQVVFDRLVSAYKEKGAMNSDMIEYFEKCNTEQRSVINKIKLELRK